jgi:hypothetical protein
MHYKFHAAWSILLPAASLCCAGSREAFSEAEGEHSGLLSALEMAQEDEGETPSQLSVPSSQHYVHAARYIMDGKEGAKVVRSSGQQSTAFTADQNVLDKVEVEQLF